MHGSVGREPPPLVTSYVRLALWLGRLVCAYGLALNYLARVLDTQEDIESRVDAVYTYLSSSSSRVHSGAYRHDPVVQRSTRFADALRLVIGGCLWHAPGHA